jgi:hypothetical protein
VVLVVVGCVVVVVGNVGNVGNVVLGMVGVGVGGMVGVVVPETLKAMFLPPAKASRELETRLGSSASMAQSLASLLDVPHVPVPMTPVITVKLVCRIFPFVVTMAGVAVAGSQPMMSEADRWHSSRMISSPGVKWLPVTTTAFMFVSLAPGATLKVGDPSLAAEAGRALTASPPRRTATPTTATRRPDPILFMVFPSIG